MRKYLLCLIGSAFLIYAAFSGTVNAEKEVKNVTPFSVIYTGQVLGEIEPCG